MTFFSTAPEAEDMLRIQALAISKFLPEMGYLPMPSGIFATGFSWQKGDERLSLQRVKCAAPGYEHKEGFVAPSAECTTNAAADDWIQAMRNAAEELSLT